MTNSSPKNHKLPQYPETLWRASEEFPSFPKLTSDLNVDVAIVGGGITGITSAYLLTKEGLKVAVIEAGNILNGTTGHTTAKITAQHGVIYDELINKLGKEKAKLYYEANEGGRKLIQSLINEKNIDCEFSIEDAYIYTNSDKEMQNLINEYKAYEKLGIDGEYVTKTELPFEVQAAVKMNQQAQYHPLKYLKRLVQDVTEKGGDFFENTTAVDIARETEPKVITKEGHSITCKHLIISSHFPFYDLEGFFFSRMYLKRSYLLAAKTKTPFPGGMYINAEKPTRSLRSATMNGEPVVLFGGDGHRTGEGISTIEHYEALADFAEETFGVEQIFYRWSAQDPKTLDKVPYVGQISEDHPNVYVATGYRKWGMTNSHAAAQLLTDLIVERENPYKDLYSPQRFHADPDVKKFISYNTHVAKELVKGKLERPNTFPEDLQNDEGAVVTVNGKRAGAYKNEQGELFIVDTTCTHMGCELNWNSGERSWDCPCHGSRFSYEGSVMEGPAETPLKRLNNE